MYLVSCDFSEKQSHCFALHVTPAPVCSHQVLDQYGWIGLGEAEWIYRIRGVYLVVFNDDNLPRPDVKYVGSNPHVGLREIVDEL
ncbi:hypothetical protein PsorP6_015410 [Peronosclerospora sorghi]|uniref:Uncharacterized protein n=1 Tax=Peronosclerospora sorghi TaxID=230839 RepID=A0ACC0WR84_9STRA|nr:hypothetical protein PsorP6_015410 [Peronosclerospora sorghi]